MRSILSLCLALLSSLAAFAQQYDVLIRNGRVVDGSGNPWVYADVGIRGDRIVFVGRAPASASAQRTIDATGLVVAPGFIDMLGQSEISLLIDPRAVSKITQGITTEITGEGSSVAPLDDRLAREARKLERLERLGIPVDWRSFDQYFARLAKQGAGINLGTFVGAAQVRRMVIGDADRAPTSKELARMEALVDEAMRQGAMGVSSSLIYAPGSYAKTEELIALARMAARHGGIYASHIRNESDGILEALDEAFRIGRDAGLPVEIWHLKTAGKQNWGRMGEVLMRIEQARAGGLDVTADQYPYIASSTTLSACIPPKYQTGGTEDFLARLRDPAQRAAMRKDILTLHGSDFDNTWLGVKGPEGILIASVPDPALKKYEGKNMAEIAAMQNKDPMEAMFDLVLAGEDRVGAVYFEMNEDDVRLALRHRWVAINNDSQAASPEGPLGESKTHPRAYGSFPRILGKYVRDEKLLPLEDAIRKFTSLPAQRMKLKDRGLLREGYFADVTIFDPATVRDLATFEDPHRTSVGIEYVFVNGVLALEKGKVTGKLGGRPLRGPGYGTESPQKAAEVTAPRPIHTPDPEFPHEGCSTGTVVLWAVIGEDGRVKEAGVERGRGKGPDRKALEAVRQWRFEPARKNGTPVKVRINIEVNTRCE
ncbi:MAG: TonB family protein [Terriglobales bacterium]